MGRRRKSKSDVLFEAAVGLIPLVVLGWIFSPQFRALIILFGVALVFILVIWICYLLWSRKRKTMQQGLSSDSANLFSQTGQTPNNFSALNSYSSSPAVPEKPSLSEQLRKMDWFQFEKLIGKIYEARGYSVKRLGGAQPDGGVDLIIEKEGLRNVVQCKQWRKWKVGVRQVREFLGTLTDSQIPIGIFITLSDYTEDAAEFANKHGIKILIQSDIIGMLNESGLVYSPEISELLNDRRKFCPKCESEMVLRTAARGNNLGSQFWGCSNYPRCRFIFQIAE